MSRITAAALVAAVLPAAIVGQQRDANVNPVGTGEIRGVVRTADAVPQPIRRAVVTISGGGLVDARSVLTDDAGRFSIARLPAGTFTVTARKAAYLEAAHGAARPGRAGSPVALTAGQRVEIALTMFKGAVISGILRDSSGAPLPGVPVNAIDTRGGAPSFAALMSQPFASDERGAFRIYGLMPGTYVVIATPAAGGTGQVGARSSSEIDAVLAFLSQRQPGRSPSAVGSAAPPPARPVAFAPVYFPGTAVFDEAERIRVQPGEERDGVNFEVSHVPVASIEGLIAGDVGNLAAVELTILTPGLRLPLGFGAFGITSTRPSAQGAFSYGNVPPGRYRIVARARRDGGTVNVPARGGGGRAGVVIGPPSTAYVGEQLFGVADVDVRGQDITGVTLALQPGGSLSGDVVFAASTAAIPDDLSGIRIALNQIGGSYSASGSGTTSGNALMSLAPVTSAADGSFRITGIGPAPYVLNVLLPANLSKIWRLRSATVDGRDLLDEIIEGPSVQLAGVSVTLSDVRTELTGTLQSTTGQPANQYFVIVFSADRAHWRAESRRSLSARPATDGRFVFENLPAGDYLLAALDDLDPFEWQEPGFLAQVAPAALRLTIADGEKKVQNLRVK